MLRKRWAVFISGRGSNLAALLDLRDELDLRLVISSSAGAYGVLRARRAGLRCEMIPFQTVINTGKSKIDWKALDSLLREQGITHIFLAGFMKVIPASFVSLWQDRILNLHPSLLPSYPGLESIERAHADGAPMGLTLHTVTAEVDAGEIFLRRRTLAPKHNLKLPAIHEYSLVSAEFKVHVDEQRAAREAIRKWKSWPMS
jgi:phosphoribosylglycinamide formyltransferase-1